MGVLTLYTLPIAPSPRLREEAATLKLSLDTQMAQLTQEAVAKDLQLQALQEQEAKFKAQLAGSQRDVDR